MVADLVGIARSPSFTKSASPVALAELPRTRETLLLRLLGSGRVLREALRDLAMLPGDAWEKSIATPLLTHFQLASEEPTTSKEDGVSAELQA